MATATKEKVALDEAFIATIKPAVVATWDYIASDMYQVSAEMDERMTNEIALEGCVDANRISGFPANAPEVDQLISAAFEQHGYKKVMGFLKKHIKLA